MIRVRGIHEGITVAGFTLAHGRDPERELVARGWSPGPVRATGRAPEVTLSFTVAPTEPVPAPGVERGVGRRRQRLAAYAVVVRGERLLLTALSEQVPRAAGLWVLPGGEVEPGEEPWAAAVREVWEETGQDVEDLDLRRVSTTHRVEADAPAGEVADFHAVRLVHTARCPHPRPARVREVGGSSGQAAWVPFGDLPGLPVAPWVRAMLHDDRGLLP